MSKTFVVPNAKYLHIPTDIETGVVGGCTRHGNPIPDVRPNTTRIQRDKNDGGCLDVFFPQLEDIKVGMLVQAYWRRERGWGFDVVDVDNVKKKVLIRAFVNGTATRNEWVPLSRVWLVWE